MSPPNQHAEPPVAFIGAGPGDPELITLKGARLVAAADLVLYAGSLVPREVVAMARPDAEVADSSPMTLEQTHAMIMRVVRQGGRVARVHTGDPGLYGAVQEQRELLEAAGVSSHVVPGVTSAFAAAATAGVGLTTPGVTQSVIITRLSGRTPTPAAESLQSFAAHGCTMAIYLSAGDPEGVQTALLAGGMAPETPVAVAHKVGFAEEVLQWTTLDNLATTARTHGFLRQTVFLALPGLSAAGARSRLYAGDFAHAFRSAASTTSGDDT